MQPISDEDLAIIQRSGLFDPDWYRVTYPDVAASGLTSEHHYLRYGFRLGRNPGPTFSSRYYRHAFASIIKDQEPISALARRQQQAGSVPLPDKGRVLLAAHQSFLSGEHDLALNLAGRHLEAEHRHTLHILQANAATLSANRAGWAEAVSSYLRHFGMDPISAPDNALSLFEALEPVSTPDPVHDGPRISVIMPVRNAALSLEKAVRSILAQSWQNLELIAVDDNSEDDSWRILQALTEEDPRLKLHHLPVNAGPYVARNIALGVVTGDWITCHDADDWAHPQRLAKHMAAVQAEHTSPCVSLTYMARMRLNGFFDTIVNANPFSPDGVTRLSSVSALYRADFLKEKLGYWDTVRVGADSEMIARAERVSGSEALTFPQIGMLCLSTEQGLTRHPVLGVRPKGHLSEIRAAYKDCWSAAHSRRTPEKLYLPFPQHTRRYQGDFGFEIPYEIVVKAHQAHV